MFKMTILQLKCLKTTNQRENFLSQQYQGFRQKGAWVYDHGHSNCF